MLDGFGTELGAINLVGIGAVLIKVFGAPWKWFKKNSNHNSNGAPGRAKSCIEHAKKLSELETKVDEHKREIHKDLNRIEKTLSDGLKDLKDNCRHMTERLFDKLDQKIDKE